jgi:hypothetical protein
MIQSITKPYQYQDAKQRLRKGQEIGVRSSTSGTREMASARSSADRYGAVVVLGVFGKRKKP